MWGNLTNCWSGLTIPPRRRNTIASWKPYSLADQPSLLFHLHLWPQTKYNIVRVFETRTHFSREKWLLRAPFFETHITIPLKFAPTPSLSQDCTDYLLCRLHSPTPSPTYCISAIGKHLLEAHGVRSLLIESHFRIRRKCKRKFNCLVYEMLWIKECNQSLNTQTDSIHAKLFVWL